MFEIMDIAILGGQLFNDKRIAEEGPLAWYRKRRRQIEIDPAILKRTILIAKWWQGSAPAAGGKVYFDMLPRVGPRVGENPRPRMPVRWMEELPLAVQEAKKDYARVVNYAGCVRNATLPECCDMTHYLLDVCEFDGIGFDAAATIPQVKQGARTDPDLLKVMAMFHECSARGAVAVFEPLPFAGTPQSVLGWSYVEDDPTGQTKANLDWFLGPGQRERARAAPPHNAGFAIAAQNHFVPEHCEKRGADGWAIGVNFRQPEVQAWVREKHKATSQAA